LPENNEGVRFENCRGVFADGKLYILLKDKNIFCVAQKCMILNAIDKSELIGNILKFKNQAL